MVRLDKAEQQELKARIEANTIQEQEGKTKVKKKGKKEVELPRAIEIDNPVESEEIQIPSPTATMPRGNRNGRNGDEGDDDRHDDRNHYWSLRDIPKFEGKGEQPFFTSYGI